jgi:hypothetical protein
LRTEAYPVYARHQYPPVGKSGPLSYDRNVELIDRAKRALMLFPSADEVLRDG